MKPLRRTSNNGYIAVFAVMLLFTLISCSGSKWALPEQYKGRWNSGQEKVTVRTWSFPLNYRFYSNTAFITIQINEDQTASGTIGEASFSNASIRKNRGNPEKTGIAFIIECGEIGKIFPNDPIEEKEVELWVAPIMKSGLLEAEIRYTTGMSHFPMAGIILKKVNP